MKEFSIEFVLLTTHLVIDLPETRGESQPRHAKGRTQERQPSRSQRPNLRVIQWTTACSFMKCSLKLYYNATGFVNYYPGRRTEFHL